MIDSPTTKSTPLEFHCSNASNICENGGVNHSSPTMDSPIKRLRTKSDDDVDNDELARELACYCEDEIANENQRDEQRNESESFQLSPIGNAGGAFS